MRKALFFISASLLSAAAFFACKKDTYVMRAGYVDLSNKAYIRLIHAAPNFRTIANVADSFNFYVDSSRINSPLLTYASVFPAAGLSSYVALDTGIRPYRLSLPGVLRPDSVSILGTFYDTLTVGLKRSYFITDTFIYRANDVFNIPQPGYYNLRFAHMVLNDTAGRTVDVYSTRRNGNLFTNVSPRTITAFTVFASNTNINDTLFVRRSGTLNNLGVGTFAFLPGSQRTYTLLYRGNGNLASGTKARALAPIIVNQ